MRKVFVLLKDLVLNDRREKFLSVTTVGLSMVGTIFLLTFQDVRLHVRFTVRDNNHYYFTSVSPGFINSLNRFQWVDHVPP